MKPSHLLAGLAWLNWFALTWLIVLSPSATSFNYSLAGVAWLFFLGIAIFASAVSWERRP